MGKKYQYRLRDMPDDVYRTVKTKQSELCKKKGYFQTFEKTIYHLIRENSIGCCGIPTTKPTKTP